MDILALMGDALGLVAIYVGIAVGVTVLLFGAVHFVKVWYQVTR